MERTMRTLFVTYHYLHGNGGSVYASRGYVNAFAELSEQLTLLCPVKDGKRPEGVREGVRIVPVTYDRPQWVKFLHLLAGRLHRYYGVFEEVLASDRFDTVVFDACYASFRLIEKARRAGCRVITIHHNYQMDYVRDNYRFPVLMPMRYWTRICEREAVLGSDLNLVLTEDDRLTLRRHYDKEGCRRFEVLGVFEYHRESLNPHAPVDKPVFVITGNLSMLQTEVPLLKWIDECYPELAAATGNLSVIVAGKNPSERLRARCLEQGIEVIASPVDMQAVLARGRYYVCPASNGGGLKLRMLDGLKNGMPVLAHVAAARGFEPFVDRYVFCYRDRASFQEALKRMLVREPDPEGQVKLYQEVFSFDAGLERLRTILQ